MNLKSAKKKELTRAIRQLDLSIKEKCFDCMANHKKIDCKMPKCPLFQFRPWVKNTASFQDFQN